MNIHSSVVMAIYIISRDGVGDGSGLIIRSSFNCILPHYNDVSVLARLPLSLYTVYVSKMGGGSEIEMWGVYTRVDLFLTPTDFETGTLFNFTFFAASKTSVDEKTEPSSSRLRRLGEACEMPAEVKIVENMFLILPGVSPS